MFTKLIHFTKMSWMFIWRFTLVSALVFGGRYMEALIPAAFIIAGLSSFVFQKTLLTWPLLRLVTGKRVVIPSNSWGSDAATAPVKQRTGGHAPRSTGGRGPGKPHVGPVGGITRLGTASRNGRITGFEPKTLEARPVPKVPSMIGAPGAGLHGAAGMSQTNIQLGVKGEENFARALDATGQIRRFGTIWSVPVPDQDRFIPGPYSTDIDCVLATGSAIFLIDLKNYKSGDVRYTAQGDVLYCEDVATGEQVGEPKTMSRNMEMATSAVRKHFPNANIVPIVVFMPTDKGEGVIENVSWPGGIPAMNLTEFLSVLAQQQDFNWQLPHAGAFGRMGNLLKMGVSKV